MLDWSATPVDEGLAEYLVAEAWTHVNYTQIYYLQVDRTNFDPVLSEEENKDYRTILPPFPGRIHVNPVDEVELNYGVNWEEGEILIQTPNWFLKQINIDVTNTSFTSLYDVMTVNDALIFGDDVDSAGNPKKWRITKISKNAFYGNESLMVNMNVIALPGNNK